MHDYVITIKLNFLIIFNSKPVQCSAMRKKQCIHIMHQHVKQYLAKALSFVVLLCFNVRDFMAITVSHDNLQKTVKC